MRVKAIIAYDGYHFQGFQKQKATSNTISSALENALGSLNIQCQIVGSGRTDAKVHAIGQVIHFDVPSYWGDIAKLKSELNRKLKYIEIRHMKFVDTNFHARFGAKRRVYRYLLKLTKPLVFEYNYTAYYGNFNTLQLQEALRLFEGEHDFDLFHKKGSEIHTAVRIINRAHYRVYKNWGIITFEANGFLRSQVRMMVDAALRCAKGELSVAMLQEQIDVKKMHTSKLAPSSGLYLAKVYY